ncbi:hypothetical protein HDU81_007548 [Chytriomyces hyalinus]|nr:hypothetical protein HDU81_007548 [Chytriomyces hyalinus]
MVAIQRTFLGQRVWPTSMLKPYFPFIISGTTAYFLFNWVAVKLKDDPTDKWTEIVNIVRDASETQKVKNEAADWYAAQIAKKEGKQ